MPSLPVCVLATVTLLAASACNATVAQKPVAVERNARGQAICPLTGEPADREADAARPAVAVKVENGPQARPQSGLEAADLVYEEPVEGGLAWLLAVFQCSDPTLIGPVRHAHPADAAILAGHTPVLFVHAGGGKAVADALDAVDGLQRADGGAGGSAFQRVEGRPIPHNLYVSMDKLRALTKARGAPQAWATYVAPGAETAKPKATASERPPRQASSVQFTEGAASIRWAWDKTARTYTRQQGATSFTDDQGRPIQVANVVFLWVTMTESDSRDAAGNRTPILTLTGKGDALVLHSGAEHSGGWVRQSAADPPRLVDRKGRPLALAPGHTWIHLVPIDSPVFVR